MLEIPNEKTLERIGNRIALVTLFIAWCMICWMLFKVFTTEPTARPPCALTDYQEIKIERYCQKHKIKPDVIEIEANGRMFYMMDGKRCEITDKSEKKHGGGG